MWRIGATIIVLGGLAILIMDLLVGAHQPMPGAARESAPPNLHASNSPVLHLPAAAGLTPAAAPALEPRRGSAEGVWTEGAALSDVRRLEAGRSDQGAVAAPSLDNGDMLARLPDAAGYSSDPQASFAPDRSGELRKAGPAFGRPSARPSDARWPEQKPAETKASLAAEPHDLPAPKPKNGDAAGGGIDGGGTDGPNPHIATAQRRLALLGYDPGPADGRPGRRTDAAVREFQSDQHLRVDGRIDDRLLARLEDASHARARLRQQELDAMTPSAPPARHGPPQDRGVIASVLGGVQRLIGRDFNSAERPAELASYCRAHADSWIYDFGREAFVFCGNIIASQSARTSSATPAPEAAATP
jgi:peptidoglycan hydrolase-like protein with peptidoglycan-binding domain